MVPLVGSVTGHGRADLVDGARRALLDNGITGRNAAPVGHALRRLSRLDDATLDRLTAGSPLTRAGLRRALVLGQLSPVDFDTALRHAHHAVPDPSTTTRRTP